MWRISIHSDFDSLGGPLSPCGSHWLRLEPFTQIRSRTLCVFSRPRLKRPCFSRLCQDHVCQDHVFQDHACQDHVWQDHFCQDLVLDTMTWSILDQFDPFLSNLIQFEHVCSSLNQFNLFGSPPRWILWSHFDTFFSIKSHCYFTRLNPKSPF